MTESISECKSARERIWVRVVVGQDESVFAAVKGGHEVLDTLFRINGFRFAQVDSQRVSSRTPNPVPPFGW